MSELHGLEIHNLVETFSIDLGPSGPEFHFINTLDPEDDFSENPDPIPYLGMEFKPWPFNAGGFTRGSEQSDVKPQVDFPDPDYFIGLVLEEHDDGIGAPVVRRLCTWEQVTNNLPPLSTDRYVLYGWSGLVGSILNFELANAIDANPEGTASITMSRQGYPGLGSGLLR